MEKKLIDVVRKYTKYPVEKMNSDTDIVSNLQINSLNYMRLLGEIENIYNIEFTDESIINFATIGDVEEYINNNI
ncbi:acyl carrier protein [uncultured Eubacterium sp.]|uniref:acyl carrier protein n=1 Tax=uncultured Eubacterium sp. TaxID=165185 RepID=UPI0025ED4B0C|nr:acyl carrier protein [uncultured Eubacterium sp.]